MKLFLMGTSNLLPGNAAWRCLAARNSDFADYNAWSRIFLAVVATLLWLVRGQAELTAFPQAMIAGRFVFMAACFVMLVALARRKHATT